MTTHPLTPDRSPQVAQIDPTEAQIAPILAEFEAEVPQHPKPPSEAVSAARALVGHIQTAGKNVELSTDVDGALSLVVVLHDDTLITGELTTAGITSAWRYDPTDWTTPTDRMADQPNPEELRKWLK